MTRPLAAGLLLLAALAGTALFAAAVAPLGWLDPLRIDVERVLAPPSRAHWFGTDGLGRDVLARTLHGGAASLGAAGLATALALSVGAALGALAGSAGRTGDALLSRTADAFHAFPPLIAALALLGAAAAPLTGLPAGSRVGLVVGLFYWPGPFRFVRAETRRLAASPLADAARAAGARRARVALLHLLPQALLPLLAPAPFVAGGAVLAEAGLGFLGVGIRPPAPSWGNLLADGFYFVESAWWIGLFPGAFLFLAVLGCFLAGEGLRRRAAPSQDI
ncbi:MAG: ABC transporter permease subunit [Acidobacteria bacterium]|jgi:peptide/nickel transport system permease protein|nr:ABC transporter permease subunit [Acidobacteriota bacterium]